MEEKKYVDGFWFNPKRPGQPDFVIGGISFSKVKFIEWLEKQEVDERGYVKAQILKSKSDGKPYAVLDTWKPDQNAQKADIRSVAKPSPAASIPVIDYPEDDVNPKEIPF